MVGAMNGGIVPIPKKTISGSISPILEVTPEVETRKWLKPLQKLICNIHPTVLTVG